MADRSRILSRTLFGGSVLLVVLAVASVVGEGPSEDAGAGAVPPDPTTTVAPQDCYGALGYFSGDGQNARYVVWRESRNEPTAQNPRSSAAGCFQLTVRHAWRFEEVGCSWAERYEPVCNTKAADHLYREAGWEPWSTS